MVALGIWAAAGEGGRLPAVWPDPALAARGDAVFATHCASCHGRSAEGQDPRQPMGGSQADGTPLAPALNGTGHAWHHDPQYLFRHVKSGSPMAGSPMVGFGDTLSDEEIAAAIAWFQSLWSDEVRARYRRTFPG